LYDLRYDPEFKSLREKDDLINKIQSGYDKLASSVSFFNDLIVVMCTILFYVVFDIFLFQPSRKQAKEIRDVFKNLERDPDNETYDADEQLSSKNMREDAGRYKKKLNQY
jgi:hypothetical protein